MQNIAQVWLLRFQTDIKSILSPFWKNTTEQFSGVCAEFCLVKLVTKKCNKIMKNIFNSTTIPRWIVVLKNTCLPWIFSIFVLTVWRRSASIWATARMGDVLVWHCSARLVVRAKCHCFSWADAVALLPPRGIDGDSSQAWETFCILSRL